MKAEADSITGQGAPTARPTRRNGWFESTTTGAFVLARQWPPRFDLRAETCFASANRRRLALQVRQDLWRELKDLRGFSPVVKALSYDQGIKLVAGGRLNSSVAPEGVIERISELLDDPEKRGRWMYWAQEAAS